MPTTVVPAPFQHVDKAFQIGIGVSVRILQRIADARLRRQMDNNRKAMLSEKRFHSSAISQIELHKREIRILLENIKARVFRLGS